MNGQYDEQPPIVRKPFDKLDCQVSVVSFLEKSNVIFFHILCLEHIWNSYIYLEIQLNGVLLFTVLSDTTDWNVFAFPLRKRKVTLL